MGCCSEDQLKPASIPLCNLVPDLHSHLFFECSFSMQIWSKVRDLFGLDAIPPCLADVVSFLIPISKGRSVKSVVSWVSLVATTYNIWKKRNSGLFRKKSSTVTGFPYNRHMSLMTDNSSARMEEEPIRMASILEPSRFRTIMTIFYVGLMLHSPPREQLENLKNRATLENLKIAIKKTKKLCVIINTTTLPEVAFTIDATPDIIVVADNTYVLNAKIRGNQVLLGFQRQINRRAINGIFDNPTITVSPVPSMTSSTDFEVALEEADLSKRLLRFHFSVVVWKANHFTINMFVLAL
ncbi:hypothetical protein Tco_0922480 [Tanacetum coccineum]|uniref:Reverse transcriptase zinc-binding domain-containing protein n=1 Tax=Tanacetum coccineum TaxID=301880 RepID=A0ABQ5CY97_9ASTR